MVSRQFERLPRTDPDMIKPLPDEWPKAERVDPHAATYGHADLHNSTVDRTDILRDRLEDLYQRHIKMILAFGAIMLVQFFATILVIVLLVNRLP